MTTCGINPHFKGQLAAQSKRLLHTTVIWNVMHAIAIRGIPLHCKFRFCNMFDLQSSILVFVFLMNIEAILAPAVYDHIFVFRLSWFFYILLCFLL